MEIAAAITTVEPAATTAAIIIAIITAITAVEPAAITTATIIATITAELAAIPAATTTAIMTVAITAQELAADVDAAAGVIGPDSVMDTIRVITMDIRMAAMPAATRALCRLQPVQLSMMAVAAMIPAIPVIDSAIGQNRQICKFLCRQHLAGGTFFKQLFFRRLNWYE